MSAEKEIVNFWYNKKGLFTINNIKAASNRDCGILALKFDKGKVNEVYHIEVSCSITNNIGKTNNLDNSLGKMISEKFENKGIIDTINKNIGQFSLEKNSIKKIIILGAVPKSRKSEIILVFNKKGVEVIELEDILYDVLENLGTEYHKNDIIRTLQLTKFLLLNDPSKLAKLSVTGANTSQSRKEFISKILDNEDIIKEFRKTNSQRLTSILKNSGIKPEELAEIVENDILNNRTRKMFLETLMKSQKNRKFVKKTEKIRKSNLILDKFF